MTGLSSLPTNKFGTPPPNTVTSNNIVTKKLIYFP